MQQPSIQNPSFTPFIPPAINQQGRLDSGAYLKQLMFAYGIALLVMQVVAMPAEVLLRKRFGERYLDNLMILLGYMGIMMLGTMWAVGSTFAGNTSVAVILYAHAYLIAVAVHKLAILHRNLKGERWHSCSDGLSWPILTVPARLAGELAGLLVPVRVLGHGYRARLSHAVTELVHLAFEPALVLCASMALLIMKSPLGLVLMWSGFAMLVKGALKSHQDRIRLLDMVDAAIEAEHRSEVLTGTKPAEETEGFTVKGVPLASATRDSVEGAFGRLDPELKAMVANDVGPGVTRPPAVMGDSP